jgi:uncharacterized protein YndB with AHSA1/START domain
MVPTVETTIRIGVPPDAVAEVLLDADLAPRWTSGLERLELVSGEPGRPGCVGRARYVENGRRSVLEDVLLAVTPNRRYLSRVSGSGLTATVETILTPVDGGETDLFLRWVGRGTNPITRIVLPLMRRRIARRAGEDLIALRCLAEGRAAHR